MESTSANPPATESTNRMHEHLGYIPDDTGRSAGDEAVSGNYNIVSGLTGIRTQLAEATMLKPNKSEEASDAALQSHTENGTGSKRQLQLQ